MSSDPQIAPDAAMALGIASTAMPFARTPVEAAERWLRVLLTNGGVGFALHELGVSEGSLEIPDEKGNREQAGGVGSFDPGEGVAHVTERAIQIARERDACEVSTTDLLMAVMWVYGADFDRVLRAHGASRDALIEQLAAGPS
jgi:hypothetical protein